MNAFVSRSLITTGCFLLIFLSGYWLHSSSKPYPFIIFTLHKLIALGALVFLIVMTVRTHQLLPLTGPQILAIAITALFFVATIVSGGLVSVEKVFPPPVAFLHQLLPYITVLSTGLTLFLLLARGGQIAPM